MNFKLPQNVQREGTIQAIYCYRQDTSKTLFYYFLCLLSGGFSYLMGRWYLNLWLSMRMVKCSLEAADNFLVIGADKSLTLCSAKQKYLKIDGLLKEYKAFIYRFYTFYYDTTEQRFIPVELDLSQLQNSEVISQMSGGITSQDQLSELQTKYGRNSTEIPDRGICNVLLEEILSPFYMFQIFSVSLWIYEDYIKYSVVIIIMSVLSILQTVYEYQVNFKKLQEITNTEYQLKVFRFIPDFTQVVNGRVEISSQVERVYPQTLSSFELVPGDLVQLTDYMIAPCDMIVLNGQVVMNEAMLTGESIPVTKSPLPFNNFNYASNEDGKQSTILAGTLCIETKIAGKGRIPVIAVVTQTGFNTQKGQLIRSILFTPQNAFKFYQDSLKFVVGLVAMTVIEFLITVKTRVDMVENEGVPASDVILSVFDLITVAIPPALPTCMQIGVSIGISRLKSKHIFCISPQKVNIAGKITVMCFDKTGTLTEDGLDFYGVRPVIQRNGFDQVQFGPLQQELFQDLTYLSENKFTSEIAVKRNGEHEVYQVSGLLVNLMACCHGLTIVGSRTIGDPLDEKLFEATNYQIDADHLSGDGCILIFVNIEVLIPTNKSMPQIRTIRKFDFSAKLQRMTVVANSKGETLVYTKGSPEKIYELCREQSIPSSYGSTLDEYAQHGFRVIACAGKHCQLTDEQIQLKERDELESDLCFLGFVILENKLKPVTKKVIQHLQYANLRTIMITGDNILTSISVARSCNIIKPNQKVLYGEIKDNQQKIGNEIIQWRDFDGNVVELDLDNLKHFEAKTFHGEKPSKQQDEELNNILDQNAEICLPDNIDDQLSEYDKMNQEEVPPWKHSNDNFVIALTGAVLMFLMGKEGSEPSAKFINILEKTQVYARMKPEEKAILIKQLQTKLPRLPLVGFCGDGANDCNALKAADVGISLSPAEASIAAPFTSKIEDISCVPILLLEGRAALTTSFTCFKFIVMYSVIESVSVCILFFSQTSLSDNAFLFIDLFIILPISIAMGFTNATEKLTKHVPKGSLICFPVIASIVGQSLIQTLFQMIAYLAVVKEPWIIRAYDLPPDQTDVFVTHTYESTTISLISNPQYLFLVIAFSTGRPFRKEFYTNIWFSICLACLLVYVYVLFLLGTSENNIHDEMGYLMRTDKSQMPNSWLVFLCLMSLLNGVITLLYERVLLRYLTVYVEYIKKNN